METTDNLSSDPVGRILVLWNPLTMILTKSAQTNQLIQFDAFSPITNSRFVLSIVYGANEIGKCRLLWEDLINLQPSQPWIITGDFNCI